MSNGREKKKHSTEIDEVEQLLQAAHDDVFLKLSLNSHTVSSSSSLESDLARRFQALKSGPPKPHPNPKRNPKPNPNPVPSVPVDDELKSVLGDDLSARFAALRTSLYSPPPSSSSSPSTTTDVAAPVKSSVGFGVVSFGGDQKEDEEDEVEMLIQWAIDAARLDPSPPSDLDTDDDEEEDGEEEDEDEDDDDGDMKRKKGIEKNKKKEKGEDNKKMVKK